MKLASRYTANFGRCSPFQRREESRLLDIAPFHCESFLFLPFVPKDFISTFACPLSTKLFLLYVARVQLVTSRFTINIETNSGKQLPTERREVVVQRPAVREGIIIVPSLPTPQSEINRKEVFVFRLSRVSSSREYPWSSQCNEISK